MDKLKPLVWGSILLLLACAGIETGQKMSNFDETTRAYGRAIRWGDYDAAHAFKKISPRSLNLPDVDGLRQARVTSYEVKQTILSESKSEILRTVEIQYYRMNELTVKTVKIDERWEYADKEDRWYLVSDLPDLK